MKHVLQILLSYNAITPWSVLCVGCISSFVRLHHSDHHFGRDGPWEGDFQRPLLNTLKYTPEYCFGLQTRSKLLSMPPGVCAVLKRYVQRHPIVHSKSGGFGNMKAPYTIDACSLTFRSSLFEV